MASDKRNPADPPPAIGRQEEEKLLAVWKELKELSKSEYPAVQAGYERARSEIWQVLFELGLKVADED